MKTTWKVLYYCDPLEYIMTNTPLLNPKLLSCILPCVLFTITVCLTSSCFADVGDAPAEPAAACITGWLGTYNETLGLCYASIFTTIFGGAFVAFFIAICWGKLVELYGALGGLIGGGVIVGTFWVINHKLPGVGIEPGGIPHEEAGFGIHQYGLVVQAFHGTGPWVDMGLAVCVGLFVASFLECLRARKLDPSLPSVSALLADALPRALSAILGGIAGGVIVGLIGFTGAKL